MSWIEKTVLIFSSINIKIGNEIYSPATILRLCPKVTYMIEDILMCLISLFKTTQKMKGVSTYTMKQKWLSQPAAPNTHFLFLLQPHLFY